MPSTNSVITRTASRKSLIWVFLRCLAWTFLGWLLYALARALWSFVVLGAPLFDWQEYLAIVVFLVSVLVYSAWRPPRPRLLLGLLGLLLAWTVLGWCGFGQIIEITPISGGSTPISFWAGLPIIQAPESVLEDLRATGGQLYLSVGKREVAGENTLTLVDGLRRLAGYDIPVYLAVRASDYLSIPVHDEWIANVREAAEMVRREQLTGVHGLLGDAERPKNTSIQIMETDRAALAEMERDMQGASEWMRRESPGLTLGVTALWMTYLDRADGDPDWALAERSTVGNPAYWDWTNVMAYSSYIPSADRAYYLYLVAQTIAHLDLNRQPSYLIGLASPGNPGEPVLTFDELVRDAQISRAMGVQEIVVYKLDDRMLQSFGPDFVRRLNSAVNEPASGQALQVPFSRYASLSVYGLLVIDAVLDVGGWGRIGLVGWMVLSGWVAWRRVCFSS